MNSKQKAIQIERCKTRFNDPIIRAHAESLTMDQIDSILSKLYAMKAKRQHS
jgi:hypothetical protein